MQQAVTLNHNGLTLRGMAHVPNGTEGTPVPAVILFHGFTGTKLEPHRIFLKISRALEAIGIASFRFDFAGSGESDGDFEDMTLAGEVSDAKAILEWVKDYPGVDANRVSLLGLSMGGLVASLVAGDRPDDVERLVLMAPAGTMYRLADEYDRQLAAGMAATRVRVEGKDIAGDHAGNLLGKAFIDGLRGFTPYDRAKAYNGPVLLIHGTKDEAVPYQVSHEYQENCYGDMAQLHIIEGADHTFNSYPWEQDVIGAITSFFGA
ncbi:alpha/beta hydrolase [Alicyclobacillus ferrooxydans]|uniref:Alpha/beta hydrolase n=1 Tax=Alicyclobacillus ferrooxydans TaxID=471514 RepID=A0A0P9GQ96_9BACL|nr:alpha/beta fold hydrolase [Alicyclobacillus ferrooxydans]KPV42966.1 alpha/beta hydrolase [Alicyclobacillus ferrooxydans]